VKCEIALWDSRASINIMKCFNIITVRKKMHWCVGMATHWIFMLLAATYVGLQYKGNTLLNAHVNSV